MTDKMTDEQRAKLQEFLTENPDAIATPVESPVAMIDGYLYRDKMLEHFEQLLRAIPYELLAHPMVITGLVAQLRTICEFEFMLQHGVVAHVDDDVVRRVAEERIHTLVMPILEGKDPYAHDS